METGYFIKTLTSCLAYASASIRFFVAKVVSSNRLEL